MLEKCFTLPGLVLTPEVILLNTEAKPFAKWPINSEASHCEWWDRRRVQLLGASGVSLGSSQVAPGSLFFSSLSADRAKT